MLVVLILEILGLIVLGLLVAPLIFYMIGVIIYVLYLIAWVVVIVTLLLARQKSLNDLAKLLNKFFRFTNKVYKQKDNSSYQVPKPRPIHSTGSCRADIENVRSVKPVCNLECPSCWKGKLDDLRLYVTKYPIVKPFSGKLKTVLNLAHRVILFYSSYYGHSTKVEKNPQSSECRGNLLQYWTLEGKGVARATLFP